MLLIVGVCGSSCQPDDALLLPEGRQPVSGDRLELLARFVHVTDSHIVDPASPARLAGTHELVPVAWREWESYSAQIYDGIIRTSNRIHASGRTIDFLIHTGDTCDNVQRNELDWFMTLMESGRIHPLSGLDDRPVDTRPEPTMDPHAPFEAQGLYQEGVHGEWPSIPWYALIGNHDVYAVGVFPIVTALGANRVAPLPLQPRLGLFLPTSLNPTSSFTHGRVTPASPGPPDLFTWPEPVLPVAERAFFNQDEFIDVLLASSTTPIGHGFEPDRWPWYSLSPLPGLRLIGLNTSDHINPIPGLPYSEGSISVEQLDWLRAELDASTARDEVIMVATHHPSRALETLLGSAADPDGFRDLLNEYPNVIVHLAGHLHQNRVADRGNYIEIETASTLDWPQEARLIEIWRDLHTGEILVGYEVFSHVEDGLPALGEDPLIALRREAMSLAMFGLTYPEARTIGNVVENAGGPADRTGLIRLRSGRE